MAKKTAQQQNDVEQKLIGYSRQTEKEIFSRFSTCEDGLNPVEASERDRKSTRLNSSHTDSSRMPSSA